MKLPREIAGFDSASAMAVALATFLRGEGSPPLGMAGLGAMRPVAAITARLPVLAREYLYSAFCGSEARPGADIAAVDLESVAGSVTDLYPRRRYPAVVIGSSGGALMHLCAALGIPWLPQTLLLPLRHSGISPDDPMKAVHAFDGTADELLDRNPDHVLHHMHDPNQDRLALRRMAYFRVKRTKLGSSYERFLSDVLEPGGRILLAECGQRWPTTRMGERHVFQLGGTGGMPPEEYQTGSAEVADYLRRYRAPVRHWEAPAPDGESPEAEWGFEAQLRDDVERFADRQGYRVGRIAFDGVEDLSPLVADLYRWWYRQRGLPANRLLIGSFILIDPWWTLRIGAVPYWTLFPVRPSLEGLHQYLDGTEQYDDMHLALFCHGVNSVGLVTADEWRDVLSRARVAGGFTGVSPDLYPCDPHTYLGFYRALRDIPARSPMPEPLALREFAAFAQNVAASHPRVSVDVS